MYTDESGVWHETYTGSFFVGGKSLGSFTYDSGRADLNWRRNGWAYFCPICGSIWAVMVATNEAGEPCAFDAVKISCPNHPDQWNTPGSLIHPSIEPLINELPAKLIDREFHLYLNELEKELV